MAGTIKITSLTDIGSNIADTTLVPVVDMTMTPTTMKATLANIANAILVEAGNLYTAATTAESANISNTAGTVTTNAQPNITSVGTLANLTVNGNVNLGGLANVHITGGANGYVLTTNGGGNLSWTAPGVNGNIASINLNGNASTVLSGAGTWIAQGGGGNANTGNIGFTDTTIFSTNDANIMVQVGNVTWDFQANGALMWPSPMGSMWHIGPGISDPDEFSIHSESNLAIYTNNANSQQEFVFDNLGEFTAPGNVHLLGTRINIGPGSKEVPLAAPSLVAVGNAAFVQTALINQEANGSSDYMMYGAGGDETQGWAGIGYNGHDWNIDTFAITGAGDLGLFVQGYSDGVGGNLVLATGNVGLGNDILFATGGFGVADEIARFSHANNTFVMSREGGGIGTLPSAPIQLQTPTVGVSGNEAEWDYPIPQLDGAKGAWQGTGTAADNVTVCTKQSDLNPNVAEFYTDEALTIPYTLPSGLFGAPGDFIAGTKAHDLYIRGGAAINATTGLGGNIILTASDGVETQWTFTPAGNIYAPGNAIFSGQIVAIGAGAEELAALLNGPTLTVSASDTEFVQGVIYNTSDNGSADWVAQGNRGDDTGGYSDFGFTSATFNDPNFTITGPGDGYLFAQGYANGQAPSIGGGNLVLATGTEGSTKDIVFATGGFESGNEFARFDHANNLFHLTRTSSGIKFFEGTELGQIEGANTFGFYSNNANMQFLLEANSNVWMFDGASGNLTTPGNLVISGETNLLGSNAAVIQSRDDLPLVSLSTNANGSISSIWVENYGDIANSNIAAIYTPLPGTGNVRIAVGNNATTVNLWDFDNSGNLTIPGALIGDTPNNNGYLNWVGNSSGDGNGYTTMNLVPDNTLTGGDQYIILDPTAPGHIHVRAGGTIDNSFASLYLGGEQSYFMVPSGSSPSVYASAGGNTWTFGNDGNLQLPGNTVAINFANGSAAFGNLVQWTTAPVANTSSGTAGQAAYDSGGNLYVCVSTNNWAKFTGTTSW